MGWAAFFKIAKGVSTFVEVVDGTADVALLSDEIARGFMGENYDPAFRDKCNEVAGIGKEVDALVAGVAGQLVDVKNLEAVLRQLDLRLDLNDFQQFQTQALTDKIGQFNLAFGSVPTAYTWLVGPAARTDSHVTADTLKEDILQVQTYLQRLAFNPTSFGLLSAALTFKGLVLSYRYRKQPQKMKEWVKKRREAAGGADLGDVELQPRVRDRRNAFSGMDMLPDDQQAAIKRLRRTKVEIAVDVVSKAGSAVSLGFTIASIAQRINSRNEAMAALDEQIEKYRMAENAYNYAIEGYTSVPDDAIETAVRVVESARIAADNIDSSTQDPDEVAIALGNAEKNLSDLLNQNSTFAEAKKFFQADDADNPDQKVAWSVEEDLGLAFGMNSVVEQYEEQGDALLSTIRNLFEDMLAFLEGAKRSDDPIDVIADEYVSEKSITEDLEQDRQRFERMASIAANRLLSTQERKDDGYDPLQAHFDVSLGALMRNVISDASNRLQDVQLANQLLVSARQIIEDADKEEQKVQARNEQAASNQNLRSFVKSHLIAQNLPHSDADITVYMQENGLIPPLEQFDREKFKADKIEDSAENEWSASESKRNPTERFPSLASVKACLSMMVLDLEKAQSAHIKDKNVWLPQSYSLPLTFSCTFICNTDRDELIPCFAKQQEGWTGQNKEALSWFMATHRHDFTFRTNLVGATPTIERHIPGFDVDVGREYRMTCRVDKQSATYWIDDQKYATATYELDKVPAQGYIGFIVFGKPDIEVKGIVVKSD